MREVSLIQQYKNGFSFLLTIFFTSFLQANECPENKKSSASIIITFFPYDYDTGASNSAIRKHLELVKQGVNGIFIGLKKLQTKGIEPEICNSIKDGYRVLEKIIEEKKESIALIHCHETDTVLPVSVIANKYNIPVILSLHCPLFYEGKILINDELPKSIRAVLSGIIGNNKKASERQVLLNTEDNINCYVTTIAPFFNDQLVEYFNQSTETHDIYLKNNFQINLSNCPLILKVANFYPNIMHKNHRLLLYAMHDLIHKRNFPVHALLVGRGKSCAYKKISLDLNIQDYVHFIGNTNKVAPLYSCADINLLSSSTEGFGQVLLEGGLFKKPTIVSRQGCGAADWLIIDKQTGFLFEDNNATDLADKIEYALRHQEEAKACGQRLYEKVVSEFLPDKIVQDLLKFYQLVQPKFILPIKKP